MVHKCKFTITECPIVPRYQKLTHNPPGNFRKTLVASGYDAPCRHEYQQGGDRNLQRYRHSQVLYHQITCTYQEIMNHIDAQSASGKVGQCACEEHRCYLYLLCQEINGYGHQHHVGRAILEEQFYLSLVASGRPVISRNP